MDEPTEKVLRRRRSRTFQAARTLGLKEVVVECPHHGQTTYALRRDGAFRCRKCNADGVVARRRRVKEALIKDAGGACEICGYNRYAGALQFHHLNPAEKAFVISRHGVTRSLAEARREAEKCVLLCANCHAEVEWGAAELDR